MNDAFDKTTATLDKTTFGMELDKRLDEVIAWAVKECPDKNASPRYADFEQVRKQFHHIATGEIKSLSSQAAAEPEDGGPQYINDNPAPWP